MLAPDRRLLALVLAEVKALRREMAEYRTSRGPRDQDDAALVGVLARAVGDAKFSAREVLGHCRENAALGEAVERATTESPRSLGRLLARLEGVTIDGYMLARVGCDRDGIVWRVCESETRAARPA
jgi:hypothetical protein